MNCSEVTKLANELGTNESNARAERLAQFVHKELFSRRWGVLKVDRGLIIFDNNPFQWDVGGTARVRQERRC